MEATLPSLVEKMKELEAQEKLAEEEGVELSDANYWEKEIVTKLLAGKIDAAAELRHGVEQRVDALKIALKATQALLVKIDASFQEAVEMNESKRLDGLAWIAKVQTNSRASTIIEDATKVPVAYKKMEVVLSSKFQADDLKEKRFWTSVILRRNVGIEELDKLSLEDQAKVGLIMNEYVSKTDVETALKKDPASVPGAFLQKGSHLRIIKGPSHTAQLEEKK